MDENNKNIATNIGFLVLQISDLQTKLNEATQKIAELQKELERNKPTD